jgi:ankyrin repeat protein
MRAQLLALFYLLSILHDAVAGGHIEVVELLISHGADINKKDYSGNTPLQKAYQYNHTNMIKLLLSLGAEPIET